MLISWWVECTKTWEHISSLFVFSFKMVSTAMIFCSIWIYRWLLLWVFGLWWISLLMVVDCGMKHWTNDLEPRFRQLSRWSNTSPIKLDITSLNESCRTWVLLKWLLKWRSADHLLENCWPSLSRMIGCTGMGSRDHVLLSCLNCTREQGCLGHLQAPFRLLSSQWVYIYIYAKLMISQSKR